MASKKVRITKTTFKYVDTPKLKQNATPKVKRKPTKRK